MIITVTLNPAIDRTVLLDELKVGALNRVQEVRNDVGGKGINVSKVIRNLGGQSIATGFLGRSNAARITEHLDRLGIRNDFVLVDGEVRTNTKIIDRNGILTEVNEKGFFVTEESVSELLEKLKDCADADTIVILSGSIPQGVNKDIYARIIRMLKPYGCRVILDADGEQFARAVAEKPYMVKPNRYELYAYLQKPEREDSAEIAQDAGRLLDMGIETVAVTLGKDGALFADKNLIRYYPGVKINLRSAVGTGDAMVGAVACGLEKRLPAEETYALGVACSAAAGETEGTNPPSEEAVKDILKRTGFRVL